MPGPVLSERDQERILELGWTLAGARSTEELAATALEKMHRLVGADGTSFLQADLHRATLRAKPYPTEGWIPPHEVTSLDRFARKFAHANNPIVVELMRRTAPFNISSIIPIKEFIRSEFYRLGYMPIGIRYQAILPIQLNRETLTGFGYAFNRSSKDFTPDEMSRVYALQSVLTAHHAALQAQRIPDQQVEAACNNLKLTRRELEILSFMASGMTAVAIGHRLRISPRTVRKHVENSYSKLGVHDRLEAVSYCRQIGLLP